MGSFMLHVLCLLAWDHDKTLGTGWLFSSATDSATVGWAQLAAVLNKMPLQQQPLGLGRVCSVTASLLALVWAHLVVKQPGGLWQPGPCTKGPWTVLATVGAAQGSRGSDLGECRPAQRVQQWSSGSSKGAAKVVAVCMKTQRLECMTHAFQMTVA
jgi:hypothetical protein